MSNTEEQMDQLEKKIAKVLNETLTSNATHARKLKEIIEIRSASNSVEFSIAFTTSVSALFSFHRRSASAERSVRFISSFVSSQISESDPDCSNFLEDFLRFLLVPAAAANKTARFRACQMISEVILRLPDDAEVSSDLWDQVIDCLKTRVSDKLPLVRTFSVRALSRFANDSDNCDILELFLHTLSIEQSSEVRKTIVMSLPVSTLTSSFIIERTLDVSESVRRSAYFVIANKFPLQSLSIKLRTTILHRGLSDRSAIVRKECLKLLSEGWLAKCCSGDPIVLLKYLDVETYETVGESVMASLLNSGVLNVKNGKGLQEIISYLDKIKEMSEISNGNLPFLEPEIALFWRIVCEHLHKEAKEKGLDAAAAMGAEAAVYAAEAADSNDLLERLFPETVSDYIRLVKTHLFAGASHGFVSRQMLLLGRMLDFSDATNRRSAGVFLEQVLCLPPEHEVDQDGNRAAVGDGVSLAGDPDWAKAVSSLARKVFAVPGEFEQVVLRAVKGLVQACRERTADPIHWMHCLSVLGFLFENSSSCRPLEKSEADLEPFDLLHSLLIPGARHADVDVQRAAVRCLGLFGLLEKRSAEEVVKQIKVSASQGREAVRSMACKALIDLRMWHGPLGDPAVGSTEGAGAGAAEDSGILDLLSSELGCWDGEEGDSVKEAVAEGFAKILLLGESYPDIPDSTRSALLARLISLYFRSETDHLSRSKQCLSVFFDHYPSLSHSHKGCLSRAFVPVMRSMWPGVHGNPGGSPALVSASRKRAVRASLFMLQMMQAPIYGQEPAPGPDSDPPRYVSGEDGLAVRIAHEVATAEKKKTAAERAYASALCRVLVLLRFRGSDQGPVKLVRGLLRSLAESVSADREAVKELLGLADRLRAVDPCPTQELSCNEARAIFGRLGLTYEGELDWGMEMPTPAAPSTRKRRAKEEAETSSSEGEGEPAVPATATGVRRSRRMGAAETMTRLASTNQYDHGSDFEDDCSDVTAEDEEDDEEEEEE